MAIVWSSSSNKLRNCLQLCPMNVFLRRKHLIIASVVLSSLAFIAFHSFKASVNTTINSKTKQQLNQKSLKDWQYYRQDDQRQQQQPQQQKLLLQHNALPPPADAQPFVPPIRLVHIDLKGAPPRIDFYAKLFPLLVSLGANALLLEYEDMFPFSGQLSEVKALNAYKTKDIIRLVSLATSNHLEVIPLVQTFGHLEFVLKLEPFSHLREVSHLPQALCPRRNGSLSLVTQMVDQVLALHPNAKFIHIGCDEVYQLGICSECRTQERDHLFLEHVYKVSEHVTRNYRNVKPIIWDDMLRQIPIETIKESGIAGLGVEPMIWTYIKDIYRFIPYSQWISFAQLFPNVWTASAFKGAFGETLTVPNVKMHLENNLAWLQVMREQLKNFRSIRGIAITGWQRYDHLATLCELLPAALPSLAVNLLALSDGQFEPKRLFSRFERLMECQNGVNGDHFLLPQQLSSDPLELLDSDPYLFGRSANCHFAGSAVFRLMQTHEEVVKRVNDYLYDVTIHKAWLTEYNVRHNMSSPYRVDEGLQEYSTVYYSLTNLMRSAKDALKHVFDRFTVAEWIEQNIYPYLLKMEKLLNSSLALKRANVWPKRPLPVLADLSRRLDSDDNNNNNNNNNNENFN